MASKKYRIELKLGKRVIINQISSLMVIIDKVLEEICIEKSAYIIITYDSQLEPDEYAIIIDRIDHAHGKIDPQSCNHSVVICEHISKVIRKITPFERR